MKMKYSIAIYKHCASYYTILRLSDETKIKGIENAFVLYQKFAHFSTYQGNALQFLKIKSRNSNVQQRKWKHTVKLLSHEAALIFQYFIEPVIASLEKIQSLITGDAVTNNILNVYISLVILNKKLFKLPD